MRFRFPRPTVILFVLCLVFVAPGVRAEALTEDLEIFPVAPGIWRHVSVKDMGDWGPVPANGLIVVGEDSAALIDTPWTDEQTALLFDWAERELGRPIRHVIPTHSHIDCLGGLGEAHRRGAASYAFSLTAEFAERDGNPVPQTTFARDHRVSLGGVQLELRYVGAGHTLDNIVVWIPERGTLFGGCLVKRKGGSAGYLDEADLDAWPDSLRALMEAYPDVSIVVPGHGKPGTLEDVRWTLEFIEGLERPTAETR